MLAHRLRRWTNIKTTPVQRLVSAGVCRGKTMIKKICAFADVLYALYTPIQNVVPDTLCDGFNPLGTRRCYDVESMSLTLIQRRNNLVVHVYR